jgi:S-formylglutathione hydrolase FrmB
MALVARRLKDLAPRLAGVAAVLLATLPVNAGSASAAAPAPARLVTITIPARHGEIPSKWLSYPGPPRANVLLPAGFDPHRRYPLLLLLNALANNYDSYRADGIVAMIEAARLDAIVVMPEGGSGWYTDWRNAGKPGAPQWETYELDDVLPTILARYPILPGRRFHAIAGFSMGGLGAAYLGGRLPGFFGSVASLSGFVDPQYFSPIASAAMGLIAGSTPQADGVDPVYGPPYGFYADGHNPTKLAVNLRHTRVFESTGTGVPSGAGVTNATSGGPAAAFADLYGSALESLIINEMSTAYHRALVGAGVDVTYQTHAGGHDLPDFYKEWSAVMAWGLFRPVAGNATSWVNRTVATSGRLWNIGYRFAKDPDQIVTFRRSGSELSISAAGSAVTVIRGACKIRSVTPATINLADGACAPK